MQEKINDKGKKIKKANVEIQILRKKKKNIYIGYILFRAYQQKINRSFFQIFTDFSC